MHMSNTPVTVFAAEACSCAIPQIYIFVIGLGAGHMLKTVSIGDVTGGSDFDLVRFGLN